MRKSESSTRAIKAVTMIKSYHGSSPAGKITAELAHPNVITAASNSTTCAIIQFTEGRKMGGEESRQSHRSQAPSTTQRINEGRMLTRRRNFGSLHLGIQRPPAFSANEKNQTQQQIVGPVLKERKEKEKNEQKGG